MNLKEFRRLYAFQAAQQSHVRHVFRNMQGRRTVKSKAKGTGQWLKRSTVKPEVGINRVFIPHNSKYT